ncbi:DNA repair exonuclease [Thiocapsa imhoffii]|uniref:DNA repair exonuclease n=1 Tax=Thiocapsa imhoffii TaxID=382777 RepID=A0A9X0WEL3_9GAMM|nr:DNA repair exonuclease [Thiocapsa imhoffii]MBK1643178.1 DNA repair exonuclease [Thiocapsa imhoffii]
MRFLHAADCHLDSPLRGLERYEGAPVEQIRSATRRAFENLVALAIEESVDFVLLAGDLYDGDWKDYNTGLFFIGQMGRLHEAGIPVYLIAGNHDAASQITRALRPPPNLHVFATTAPETHRIEDLGVAIHGQGFATRAVTQDLTQGYPQGDPAFFNIGLLHTSLDGRPGHEPYAPCRLDGLRSKGYQYWALGHVHQRELIASDPVVLFPGNIQGRHIRETGPKGCTLVRVEGAQVIALEERALDVVRWVDCPVEVTPARTLDQLDPLLETALVRASETSDGRILALRLRLVGRSPLHARLHAERERVLNECRALVSGRGLGEIWIEKLLVETHADQQPDALTREDALGGLLRAIQELELEDAGAASLAEEVAGLTAKLPPALRGGEEAFDPTRPEHLRSALEDVKALLLERLLDPTGPSEARS